MGLPVSSGIETNFDLDVFPDRDSIKLFSVRIPISVVIAKEPGVLERVPRKAAPPNNDPDSINVKIENDEGYVCAEVRDSRHLEISGLPCDQCMRGKLTVTVETRKKNGILSKFRTLLSDESKRAEICSLQPENRKEGEDLVVTSLKENPEDGCRWVFRDAGGSTGCCFSNRDYYTQTGGCDPRMQSSSCRKGSEKPILVEEENSFTLRISNLRPADSGNYLSNFQYETPGFKKVLVVECEEEWPLSVYLTIILSLPILFGALALRCLSVQRASVLNLIKETAMNSKKDEIKIPKYDLFVGQQKFNHEEGLIVSKV